MRTTAVSLFAAAAVATVLTTAALAQNNYTNTVLVASDPFYEPLIMVDPLLSDGWGLALRPPGAGGHIWVSNFNTGTTTTYVGDVHTPTGFKPLSQDSLTSVDIAPGAGIRVDGRPTADTPGPTGQVFNFSTSDFVVSGEGITGASKFIFVTGEGTISGWTEQTIAGVLHRQTRSVVMVDQSQDFDDNRLRFTGCAITDFPSGNRLYVTNWTMERVEVYDANFQRIAMPVDSFRFPGEPEGFRPWNIQYLHTGPNGEGRLWVAYNLQDDPWEEDPGWGAVAEFDLDGRFVRRLINANDIDPEADSILRDPWGLVVAPANFGPLSNALLVGNFGDGTIAAFDLSTLQFIDFLRDDHGQRLLVDGIWGMNFGNGVALGDTDAMYYAAGPAGEDQGTFGTVRFTPSTCPVIQTQPGSARTCVQGDASISVEAPSPVRLAFQWQVQIAPGIWADLSDGPLPGLGGVSGSTSRTLAISSASHGSMFRCTISNACGSVTSDAAALTINSADFNGDGDIGTDADIGAFFACLSGDCCASCGSADFNADGDVGTDSDIESFFRVLSGGSC